MTALRFSLVLVAALAVPALAQDPNAEVDRAQALYNEGKIVEAKEICDAVLAGGAAGAAAARAHHCRAIIAFRHDAFDECLAEANAALAIEKRGSFAFTGSRCALKAQRFEDANRLAADAAAAQPDNGDAYQIRCGALTSLNRPAEALPVCERGAALQPQSGAMKALLGVAYEASGDPAKAAQAYRAALAIDPGNAAAQEGLARTGGQ